VDLQVEKLTVEMMVQQGDEDGQDGFGRGGFKRKSQLRRYQTQEMLRSIEYFGYYCIKLVALVSVFLLPEFEEMKLGSLCSYLSSRQLIKKDNLSQISWGAFDSEHTIDPSTHPSKLTSLLHLSIHL